MNKEDWLRIAKLSGYVYLPIVLLLALVFVLVQYYQAQQGIEGERIAPRVQDNTQLLTK